MKLLAQFGRLFLFLLSWNLLLGSMPKEDGDRILVPQLYEIVFLSHCGPEEKELQNCHGILIDPYLFIPKRNIFIGKMRKFLHHPVSWNYLKKIQAEVENFYTGEGYIATMATFPQEQDITEGKVILTVIVGQVDDIDVIGNKYFSSRKIILDLSNSRGKYITRDLLQEDRMWINENPFIKADLMLAKGKKYGKTDLIVNVKDRLPFRPFIGYENSGYKVATSQNRYYVGFNWGNVFNLAQQLNFQMMTTDRWNEWRGFTASYIIPFKWRTSLKLIGNYVRSNSDKLQKSTHVKGHSYQTGFRYECPLVKWGARHMFVIGYDYKYANNFESFLQEPVYNKNVAVSQFCLGYDLKESDRYGNINANIYLYLSPGKMMTYNNDYYFNIQRAGARADYVYVNLTFERITTLGHGFSWVLNSFGQATGNKLLPSEEITIGGFDTVRGYSQNKFIGDMGFVIRNEIRSPYLSLKKTNGRDKTGLTQFLIFCDYGKAYHFNPNLLNRKSSSLLSVGPGIRETISDHFNLRVDYGFRLKKALQTSRSRMGRWHVGASLAY